MKKILTSLLVVFLFVALVGCEMNINKSYKISFDTDGGSKVEDIIAAEGAAITKPADPTKEGLTFGGWYADIDLTEPYEFPAVMPKANTMVYAKWVVTLSFDSQGGSMVDPIVADPGSVFVMPQNPSYGDYVFVGWYYGENLENKLTYVMPRTNTTVYAKWEVFEEGSAIELSNDWLINDAGSFFVEPVEEGTKITATPAKGSWSYVYVVIDGNAKDNRTVVAVLEGTAGATAVLKLEGGNAEAAAETSVEFTGEEQRIVWTVEAKNLTSVGGQKFLIFLNGGTEGCGETPEYVIVKSVGLYRTIDANDPQRSVLAFMTNGGTEIASYYLEPNTPISAPADPEKQGYKFAGWYADAALTIPYEFTVMPEHTTIIYAAWAPEVEYLEDVDLMGRAFNILDEGSYVVQNNEDSYVLQKTAEGSEWQCIVLPMTGLNLGGYNLLRVEVQGTAGEQVLFKINDMNAGERYVTLTGEKQYLELAFDFDLDPAKSLVVFVKPGVAGESGEVTITKLAYGNYARYINLLTDGWYALDEGVYEVAFEGGVLTFAKNDEEGREWSVIVNKIEGVKFDYFDTFKVKFRGPEGEQVIFKVNDNGAGESWQTATGEVQELTIPLNFAIDPAKFTIVAFANPGAIGTGNVFEVFEMGLYMSQAPEITPVEPTVEPTNVNLIGREFAALDAGTYEIENNWDSYVLAKTENGGEWQCMVLPMTGLDLSGLNLLKVEIQGTAGEQIMFKINDMGAGERTITLNGEKQYFELAFDFELDPAKSLVVFIKPGVAGASGDVTITKLAYSNFSRYVDVLGYEFTCLEEGAYEYSQEEGKLTMAKVGGGEWSCVIVLPQADLNGQKIIGFEATVKGPEGERMLLKANDAYEQWVDATGEVQEVKAVLTGASIDGAKNLFVIFANPMIAGTSNSFEITRLVYVLKDEIENVNPNPVVEDINVDLMGREFAALDAGTYDIQNNEDSYVLAKTENGGEWQCMVLPMTGLDLSGLNLLKVEIQGTEGEQIMFKINDMGAGERTINLTGSKQYVELAFDFELDPAKSLVVFIKPGVAGASGAVTITKLAYSNYSNYVDVLSYEFTTLEPAAFNFTQEDGQLTFAKVGGGEWSCLIVTAQEALQGQRFVGMEVTFEGPEGEQMLIKPNDNGAAEAWISCTGETQKMTKSFDITIGAGNFFVIFANPMTAGTGNSFTITRLVLIPA